MVCKGLTSIELFLLGYAAISDLHESVTAFQERGGGVILPTHYQFAKLPLACLYTSVSCLSRAQLLFPA